MVDVGMLIGYRLFLTSLYFLKEKMSDNKFKHNIAGQFVWNFCIKQVTYI